MKFKFAILAIVSIYFIACNLPDRYDSNGHAYYISDSVKNKYRVIDSFATDSTFKRFDYIIFIPDTSSIKTVNDYIGPYYSFMFPDKWIHLYYFDDTLAAKSYLTMVNSPENSKKRDFENHFIAIFTHNPFTGKNDFYYTNHP